MWAVLRASCERIWDTVANTAHHWRPLITPFTPNVHIPYFAAPCPCPPEPEEELQTVEADKRASKSNARVPRRAQAQRGGRRGAVKKGSRGRAAVAPGTHPTFRTPVSSALGVVPLTVCWAANTDVYSLHVLRSGPVSLLYKGTIGDKGFMQVGWCPLSWLFRNR